MKPNYKIITSHFNGSFFEVYNYEPINEVHVISWYNPIHLKQNNHSIGVWKPKSNK